jgi:hypothetical protein
MFDATTPALDRLSRRLARQEAGAEVALRFTRRDGGWKLDPDQVRAGDLTFAHEGRKVLLLDETTARAMDNLTLVVRSTAKGPRLRLRRGANRGN